jgi:uncharacterized protein
MISGIGIGLRLPFARALLADAPSALSWLEIHPENYVARGGRYERLLTAARERFPVLTHGLTMGFGALAPFDPPYLRGVRGLIEELGCPWHSDHLCVSEVEGVHLHDLLPLPRTEETVDLVALRVREARAALGVPIAVEHISYYVEPKGSTMSEAAFLCAVLERADAKLLLDVNNVVVNAHNHGFDPRAFVDALPLERVVQLHVAGHRVQRDGLRIDTHAEPICDEVYALFAHAITRLARPVPVLLERDDNFPDFGELAAEVARLDAIYQAALAQAAKRAS